MTSKRTYKLWRKCMGLVMDRIGWSLTFISLPYLYITCCVFPHPARFWVMVKQNFLISYFHLAEDSLCLSLPCRIRVIHDPWLQFAICLFLCLYQLANCIFLSSRSNVLKSENYFRFVSQLIDVFRVMSRFLFWLKKQLTNVNGLMISVVAYFIVFATGLVGMCYFQGKVDDPSFPRKL